MFSVSSRSDVFATWLLPVAAGRQEKSTTCAAKFMCYGVKRFCAARGRREKPDARSIIRESLAAKTYDRDTKQQLKTNGQREARMSDYEVTASQ